MNIQKILQTHASRVILQVFPELGENPENFAPVKPVVDSASDLGDYCIVISRGEEVAEAWNADEDASQHATASHVRFDACPTLGFVNLRMKDDLLCSSANTANVGFVESRTPPRPKKKILVDFSGPNFAKKMHVGHLRSTLIGDQIARALEAAGHDVTRINHVGDWGSQFGTVLAWLRREAPAVFKDPTSVGATVAEYDLSELYATAREAFGESDPAREETLKLQSGDPESLAVWAALCASSRKENDRIYGYLNVELEEKGESAYRDELADVVSELISKGIAYEDDDTSVWVNLTYSKDGDRVIVRKSDGAYNYLTTDLAAIRDRARKYDFIYYVADMGQRRHFNSVNHIAVRAGWLPVGEPRMKHVGFGVVVGKDGKRLKSRDGNAPGLWFLMNATAVAVQTQFFGGDRPLNEATVGAVAIGALRFAELSHKPESDHRFDIDEAISLKGKTGAYVQYARARAHSLLPLADDSPDFPYLNFKEAEPPFPNAESRDLAMALARFDERSAVAVEELSFAQLCDYLYDLARTFNRFYEATPVASENNPVTKDTLLSLCACTSLTLSRGLAFLGIESPAKL